MFSFRYSIGDLRQQTGHLSALEHGVFIRLVEEILATEAPLRDDMAFIARRLRLVTKAERDALVVVLSELFTRSEQGWTCGLCEGLISAYRATSEKARRSAGARWGADPAESTGTHSGRDASAMRAHSGGTADAMPTMNHESRIMNQKRGAPAPPPPDGVASEVWSDYLKLRRGRRAAISETALASIRAEAAKAGLTLEAALRMCCARGWSGFEAAWVQQAASNSQEPEDRRSGRDPALLAIEEGLRQAVRPSAQVLAKLAELRGDGSTSEPARGSSHEVPVKGNSSLATALVGAAGQSQGVI